MGESWEGPMAEMQECRGYRQTKEKNEKILELENENQQFRDIIYEGLGIPPELRDKNYSTSALGNEILNQHGNQHGNKILDHVKSLISEFKAQKDQITGFENQVGESRKENLGLQAEVENLKKINKDLKTVLEGILSGINFPDYHRIKDILGDICIPGVISVDVQPLKQAYQLMRKLEEENS